MIFISSLKIFALLTYINFPHSAFGYVGKWLDKKGKFQNLWRQKLDSN